MSPAESSPDGTRLRDIQGLMAQSDEQIELMKKGNEANAKLLNEIAENINGQGTSNQAFKWTSPAVHPTTDNVDVKNFGNMYPSGTNNIDFSSKSVSDSTDNIVVPLRPAKQGTYFPMLYVGDSIGHYVDFDFLQRESNCYITAFKAYSAEDRPKSNFAESPRFPDQNFEAVVKRELKTSPARYLLMTGGSVDITNLRTGASNPERHSDDFKSIVNRSARKMFQIAEDALSDYKFLEKVILMERTPRIDSKYDDPMGYKAQLSDKANMIYWELWEKSSFKDKIVIGKHRFNSQTRDIFHRSRDNRYDGIHLFGPKGRSSFTESIYGALQQANLLHKNPLPIMTPAQNAMSNYDHASRTVNDQPSNIGYLVTRFDPNLGASSSTLQSKESQPLPPSNDGTENLLDDNKNSKQNELNHQSTLQLSSNANSKNIKIERNDSLSSNDAENGSEANNEMADAATEEYRNTSDTNAPLQENSTSVTDPQLNRHLGLQIPGVKVEPDSDVLVTNDIIKNDNWINPKKEAQSNIETDDMSSLSMNVCLGNSGSLEAKETKLSSNNKNDISEFTGAKEEDEGSSRQVIGSNEGEASSSKTNKYSPNKIRQHYKGRNKKAKYACKHCPLATDDKTEFVRHKDTHKKTNSANKYICENNICGFSASKRKDIRKHDEEVHHKLKKIREKIAGNSFKLSKFIVKPTPKSGTRNNANSDEPGSSYLKSTHKSTKERTKTSLNEKNLLPPSPAVRKEHGELTQFINTDREGYHEEFKDTSIADTSGQSIEPDRNARTLMNNATLNAYGGQQNNEIPVSDPAPRNSKVDKHIHDTFKSNESSQSTSRENYTEGRGDPGHHGNQTFPSPRNSKKISVEKVATVLKRRRSSNDEVEKIALEQKDTIMRAIQFMRKVKEKLKDHPEKISGFHDLMQDYKEKNQDEEELLANATQLFSPHQDLIEGFKLMCIHSSN